MKRRNIVAAIGLTSLSCLGIDAASADPTVTNISQLSEKRITRMVFEYTYSATITNDATGRNNVVATLTAVGPGTSIVDGVVKVGVLSANQAVTSPDTFTIRQDRTVPFSSSAMVWIITGDILPINTGLPPDPGPEGDATLLGIDSDQDGVRDDVQRYIAITYPDSEKTRLALTDLAKTYQQALQVPTNDSASALTVTTTFHKNFDCLIYLFGVDDGRRKANDLRAQFINTVERLRAYSRYDDQLGGATFELPKLESTSCSFDLD